MIPFAAYKWIAGVVLLVVAVGACGVIYGHWKEKFREEGRAQVRAEYAVRDAASAEAALRALKQAQDAVRAEEQAKSAAIAKTAQTGQKRLQELANENASLAARLASGAVVFRDPGSTGCAAPRDPDSPGEAPRGAAVGSSPGGGELHQESGGVLSARAAEFILGEAARADQIATILQACQTILVQDRQ